tara:strand:+ start:2593 stop:3489 length:897 start_codon:yes stop_codon:yes gene_type:complete
MSTQQARNIVNTQIDNLITRAKTEIKNEGKKKIAELKAKIPTPQTLKEKLKAEINVDSCSEGGHEKFMKIYNGLNDALTQISEVIGGALEKIEGIESQIKPIMEEKGPIGQIKGVATFLQPITQTLQIIILAAPILLSANSGPTSSGAVTDQVVDKRNKAFSKVKEYVALIACIPLIILYYVNQAEKVFIPLRIAKSKLSFMAEELSKLQMFLHSLLLEFEGQCAAFEIANNGTGIVTIEPPVATTPLEDYLSVLSSQYDDVYQYLLDNGNDKAIERIFTIKENLEKDYYTSHRVINF